MSENTPFSFEFEQQQYSFELYNTKDGRSGIPLIAYPEPREPLCFVVATVAFLKGLLKLVEAVQDREGLNFDAPGGFLYAHECDDSEELEPGVTLYFMNDEDMVATEDLFKRFVVAFTLAGLPAFEEVGLIKAAEVAAVRTGLQRLQAT